MWEDEANKNGGRWQIRVNKGFSNRLWEDLILAMIGEQFDPENEIHGIVISVRPNGDTISLWHKNSRDPAIVEKLRVDMINMLKLPDDIKMDYAQFFPDQKGVGARREERKDDRKYQSQGVNLGPAGNQQQNQLSQAAKYKPKTSQAPGGQGQGGFQGDRKRDDVKRQ